MAKCEICERKTDRYTDVCNACYMVTRRWREFGVRDLRKSYERAKRAVKVIEHVLREKGVKVA